MNKNELTMISAYTRIKTMKSEANSIMSDLHFVINDLTKNHCDYTLDIKDVYEDMSKAYFAFSDAIDRIEELVEEYKEEKM